MASSFTWLLKRQYVPDQANLNDVTFSNRMVEHFSCTRSDEYHIEGEMGMPLPPFVARFSPYLLDGNMLGAADEDGHVKLIDTRKTKNNSIVKEWSAHSNAVFDLAWVGNEPKLVTASGDQTAKLWDIEKAETAAIFRGHTCSLKSVDVQPQSGSVFLTGARDGNIMLWDTRCNMKNGFFKPINTIHNAHVLPQKDILTWSGKKRKSRRASTLNSDSKQSVTAVVFQDNNTIISSGACDGTLKYWDLRKHYKTHKQDSVAFHVIHFPGKGPKKHGYSSLVLNSSLSRLYAVCTNDVVYEYATTNLSDQPIAVYQGHLASSFYVKAALSPDDRYLLCGSSDSHAYIWRINQPSDSWILKGHYGEVTSVAWSPNGENKIVTCSDDNTFKVWRLFQNIEDIGLLSGKCEASAKKLQLKEIQKTGCLQSEEIFLPVSNPKSRFLKPINLCTNNKVNMRWTLNPVNIIKDFVSPICRTPDATNQNGDYSFTILTPRRELKDETPKSNLRQQLLTPTSTSPSFISPLGRRRSETRTPKSSRLFMESWLKSPSTPKSKKSEITKQDNPVEMENRKLFAIDENHERKDAFTSSNKVVNKTQSEATLTVKNSKNIKLTSCSNADNSCQKQTLINSKVDLKNTFDVKLEKRKITERTPIKRKRVEKPSANIKLLITDKRKKDSPENKELCTKRLRTDKENYAANSEEICNTEGKASKVDKKDSKADNLLKNKTIKDLLDHAEE